jgi:hypothetical protein
VRRGADQVRSVPGRARVSADYDKGARRDAPLTAFMVDQRFARKRHDRKRQGTRAVQRVSLRESCALPRDAQNVVGVTSDTLAHDQSRSESER